MPYLTDLHPFTASLLTAFRIPEQHRVLHESRFPLCTFGYAVTRSAAERIINTIAPLNETLIYGIVAYDVALLYACRDRKSLSCYSIQPELFHHMEGTSIIADAEANERKVFLPPVDAKGEEQVRWRGETSNIGCGFWSGEFYYDDDTTKLDYFREEVGRKGKCLKPGPG